MARFLSGYENEIEEGQETLSLWFEGQEVSSPNQRQGEDDDCSFSEREMNWNEFILLILYHV